MTPMKNHNYCIFILFSLLFVTAFVSDCEAGAGHHHDDEGEQDKPAALKLKIVGIVVILIAGALGVLIPILGRWVPAIRPEKDFFFVIKAFAAGVILATSLVHILPESFDRLGSEDLNEDPWHNFPFAGFIAMLSALGALTVDTLATSYYKRRHVGKARAVGDGDEEKAREHADFNVPVHSHQVVPGPEDETGTAQTIRQRVITQVLELGIVVHSVIIGITVGTSQSPSTIRPLVAALSFHQFFEGMGLGSCIVQARFKAMKVAIMAIFFSITTPIGIAIGIGVASSYDADSATALIVQGVLDAAAAGILIYMALVCLLAADFMSPRMQNSGKLQLLAHAGLLLGAGAMSFLAKWA